MFIGAPVRSALEIELGDRHLHEVERLARLVCELHKDRLAIGAVRHTGTVTGRLYAIEALDRQLREAIKAEGSFPSEDAARKLIYRAPQNAVPQWTRT